MPDAITGWVHTDGTACSENLAPPASTPPTGYWCTTHQMYVRHPDSPPAPDPSVILAGIRELISDRDNLAVRMDWDDPAAVSEFNATQDKLAARTPLLLAAVEAALKLHAPVPDGPEWCRECGHSFPCWTVRAITAALTGQEASDGS